MESATRAFYARSDLDLILSSPASAAQVHCVRIAAMAVSISLMGLFLAARFINVLALLGGARWLAAYAVVSAMGLRQPPWAWLQPLRCFASLARAERGSSRRSSQP